MTLSIPLTDHPAIGENLEGLDGKCWDSTTLEEILMNHGVQDRGQGLQKATVGFTFTYREPCSVV